MEFKLTRITITPIVYQNLVTNFIIFPTTSPASIHLSSSSPILSIHIVDYLFPSSQSNLYVWNFKVGSKALYEKVSALVWPCGPCIEYCIPRGWSAPCFANVPYMYRVTDFHVNLVRVVFVHKTCLRKTQAFYSFVLYIEMNHIEMMSTREDISALFTCFWDLGFLLPVTTRSIAERREVYTTLAAV